MYCMYFYGALDSISSILQLEIDRVSRWYAVLADESDGVEYMTKPTASDSVIFRL